LLPPGLLVEVTRGKGYPRCSVAGACLHRQQMASVATNNRRDCPLFSVRNGA